MAAFLTVFHHNLDNGSFGIEASRVVESGGILRLVNRTYALAI